MTDISKKFYDNASIDYCGMKFVVQIRRTSRRQPLTAAVTPVSR